MDGQGYMVGREDYKAYLKSTHHPLEVSFTMGSAVSHVPSDKPKEVHM